MDKIYVNQMAFYGYHGVFKEENTLGQKFVIDVVLELDLTAAGRSDNLDETINYAEIYNLTKDIAEGPPYDLVEAVGEAVAENMLKTFEPVQICHVKVTKPGPPIPGYYESVAVEITRQRTNE